jgi:hypothetical protein
MPRKTNRKRSALTAVRGSERAAAIAAGELHLYRPKARTEALKPKVANRNACRRKGRTRPDQW